MKTQWIAGVIVIQLIILGAMAGEREWIRHYGQDFYLRTAPVDPRDIFRGDYVTLDYDIAVPSDHLIRSIRESLPDLNQRSRTLKQRHPIYVSLNRDQRGVAFIDTLQTTRPQTPLFIKGSIGSTIWRRHWSQRGVIHLGIEKYFVEQDSGKAIERIRGQRDQWQTPMELLVAVGGGGTAVIKGHRWSDLSVRLEVLEEPDRNRNSDQTQTRISPSVRVSLRNRSDNPIALLVSGADYCEFHLIENPRRNALEGFTPVHFPHRSCSNKIAKDYSIKTLDPGGMHTMTIDFSHTQWWVEASGMTQQLGEISDRWSSYRWVYQPPTFKEHSEEHLWLTSIKTARFNARGRVD